MNVSTSLRGDFTLAHTTGDQPQVLPTDTQKNTCYAYAKEKGLGEIESYALDLARHFVNDVESVDGARVIVEEYAWERVNIDDAEHDAYLDAQWPGSAHHRGHRGRQGRCPETWVVSGLKDLVVLKSTGSEFRGYLRDRYTMLGETSDRIMATSLTARWRYLGTDVDWGKVYNDIRRILLARFAEVHSLALQQTLWEMGRAVLLAHPEVAEVMLTAPNKHHFVVDLSPFGLDNPNEVFHADDRPYGLIECNVTRNDAPPAGPAWQTVPGLT